MWAGTQGLILFSVVRSPQIFKTWFRLLLTAYVFSYTSFCRHGEVTHGIEAVCVHQREVAAQEWEGPLEFAALALWFDEHALYQQGRRKIDLEIRSPVFITRRFSFQGGNGRFLLLSELQACLWQLLQTHRMVEAGRNLWISSHPTPLPKQGHLWPVTQEHVPLDFNYLQVWRVHSTYEQLLLVFGHWFCLEQEKKKAFPGIQVTLPVFQFISRTLVLALGTTGKKLGPSILFAPSLQVFIYSDEIQLEPAHLWAEQSKHTQPFLTGKGLQFFASFLWPFLIPSAGAYWREASGGWWHRAALALLLNGEYRFTGVVFSRLVLPEGEKNHSFPLHCNCLDEWAMAG